MTIESPNTINTTRVQTGQPVSSIDPVDMQVLVDSLSGVSSPAAKTATPYVLTLADRGTCIEMNLAGANAVNIPTNASVAFDIGTVITVYQMGAGTTTIQAVTPGTTTVRPTAAPTIRAQYSTVSIRKRATDEWVVMGDIT